MLLRFLEAIESGEKSAADLLAICLRRIGGCEADVRAWVEVNPQRQLRAGPLGGIPFGVKDIFETLGLATEFGSPLYEGRKGECDARVVTGLQRCGAVVLGKTRTAAFASFDPPATSNPRLPGHTPGGSSSGSAAAVAAGMVPFALGTQTLGSVLRPASFCGVCGFKPTFGLLSTEGVMPFAPSLDTVGLFTESAADMAELWSRGFGGAPSGELSRAARWAVSCEEPMRRALEAGVARLRAAGAAIDDVEMPAGWIQLVDAARTINAYEGARTQRDRFQRFGTGIGQRLAALVRDGLLLTEDEYERARVQVDRMKAEVRLLFREYPAILTPAASGTAPAGLASTGDPSHNAPWSALGTPAVSIPLPVSGAPLGMQIAAAWGRDDALLGMAACAASFLASPGFGELH